MVPCPWCGAEAVGRVRGLQGPLEVLICVALLLCLIVPGLIFYIVREGTPYCSACGRRVPKRYLAPKYRPQP